MLHPLPAKPSQTTPQYLPRHWFGPLVVSLLTFLIISFQLDPAGDYPLCPLGPGLTVDEIFNVSHGSHQLDRLLAGDLAGYRKVVDELPDHPPAGRLWLGLWNELGLYFDPPTGTHSNLVVACSRWGAASAFAILIFLSGFYASQWYGNSTGWWTSVVIAAFPRLWGHAHLAVLELPITLAYAATLYLLANRWKDSTPPLPKTAALTGLLFGLALLTKIQAVLLPIPVTLWALARWKHQAILPILIWGLTGTLTLFLGWTWFWGDPLSRFPAYLTNNTGRTEIWLTYLGHKMTDKNVPWHYPWVIFATTIPLPLLGLGICGLLQVVRRGLSKDPQGWLIIAGLLFPLILFSLPKISVYDGERLFLTSYPLWGILVGIGGATLSSLFAKWWGQRAAIVLSSLLLLTQFTGHLLMHPCYLSYYNLLVGGIAGAEKLGLQVTYWGDGLTRDLIQKSAQLVPQGGLLELAPVLHPNQVQALLSQSPSLHQKQIQIVPFEEQPHPNRRYLLMFPRREYLPDSWKGLPPDARPILEIRRQGVVMAGLYERGVNLPPPP